VFNRYHIYDADQSTALVKSQQMPPVMPNSPLLGHQEDFSLEEAYIAFDLRESYLQRQSNSLAAQADSIYLETEDFATKTDNMYRSDDLSIYPNQSSSEIDGNELISYKEKYA